MHRRLHLFAHQPRKLRHRIQHFDLLDEVEKDLFLTVGFAEKSPINPMDELAAEFQTQSSGGNQRSNSGLPVKIAVSGRLRLAMIV